MPQREDEAVRPAPPPAGPPRRGRAEPGPVQDVPPGSVRDPAEPEPTGQPQPHLLRRDVRRGEHGDAHSRLHLHPEQLG